MHVDGLPKWTTQMDYPMHQINPTLNIYGIKNCATMQKAFAWCAEQSIPYVFHDYKKQGIDTSRLATWCAQITWQSLINTRGTTWRKLSAQQQTIETTEQAITLMREFPSLIKRPLFETPDLLLVGFNADHCTRLIASLRAGQTQ